jgi:hypothetical protein
MHWQKQTQYGRRNYSELSIQRYKKILGNKLHARELSRQKQEVMIGSSVLNKMTSLGMLISYGCACKPFKLVGLSKETTPSSDMIFEIAFVY